MAARHRIIPPGFTLIELTIAMVIFAIVGSALLLTLRSGTETWKRLRVFGAQQQQLRFALNRMQRDMAHAVLLTGRNDTPPIFTQSSMEFVTMTETIQAHPRVTRVRLQCDAIESGRLALTRASAPYPAAPDSPLAQTEVLLSDMAQCRFAYLYIDEDTLAMTWEPVWQPEEKDVPVALPRGIQLTVHAGTDGVGATSYVFEIPTGSPGLTGSI